VHFVGTIIVPYILFVHLVGTMKENSEERVSLPPTFGTEKVSPKIQTPVGQPI
jgi:hypothetical protein